MSETTSYHIIFCSLSSHNNDRHRRQKDINENIFVIFFSSIPHLPPKMPKQENHENIFIDIFLSAVLIIVMILCGKKLSQT